MYESLNHIADIRQGHAFRGKIDHDPNGEVGIVQSKDIADNGTIATDGIARMSGLPGRPEKVLKPDDIVLQSRGLRYPAALVGGELGVAVAAAPLYVIRPRPGTVDPDYLLQALLNSMTQAAMRRRATGTYVPQLKRQVIEEIEIPLPSLDAQRRLTELARLYRREFELAKRLATVRTEELWALMRREAVRETQGRGNAPGP